MSIELELIERSYCGLRCDIKSEKKRKGKRKELDRWKVICGEHSLNKMMRKLLI